MSLMIIAHNGQEGHVGAQAPGVNGGVGGPAGHVLAVRNGHYWRWCLAAYALCCAVQVAIYNRLPNHQGAKTGEAFDIVLQVGVHCSPPSVRVHRAKSRPLGAASATSEPLL